MAKLLFYITCVLVCLLAFALYAIPTHPRLFKIGDTIAIRSQKTEEQWGEKRVWAGENESKSDTYTIPDGWEYVTHDIIENGKIGDAQLSHSRQDDGKRTVAVTINARAGSRQGGVFGLGSTGRPSIGGILRVKTRRTVPETVERAATAEDVASFRASLGIKSLPDEIVWRAKNNPVVGVALLVFSVGTAILGAWLQIMKLSGKKGAD
jgi:hypothetical protein